MFWERRSWALGLVPNIELAGPRISLTPSSSPCLRVSVFIFIVLLLLSSSSYLSAESVKPEIDEADNRVAADFQRVKASLADRQWGEAIEILRRVMEESGEKLWPITKWRYITVCDYCQLQLATLPQEALATYRGRVDPAAKDWLEEGVKSRNRAVLLKVVRRAFASSYGDDALMALGEIALERADYAAARDYWERILPPAAPVETPAAEIDQQARLASATWLAYPDTDINAAAVRARLVLTSILEGSHERARRELARFEQLHAEGCWVVWRRRGQLCRSVKKTLGRKRELA